MTANKLATSRWLDVALALWVVWAVVQIAQAVSTRGFEYDFNHYYVSSRLLATGHNPYRTPLAPLSRELGFTVPEGIKTATNPPLLLWLLVPLSVLPPRAAFGLWVVVELVSLGAIVWMTLDLLEERLTRRGRWLVAGLAVAVQPVFWNFYFSHVELLIAAALLAAYRWHVRGKHTAACVTVLGTGLLKLYPLALLPWFIWRGRERMRTIGLMAGLGVVLLLLAGPGLWKDFWKEGADVVRQTSIGRTFNFSLPAFVANLGPVITPSSLWLRLGIALGLVLLGATYAVCIMGDRDDEREFCLLCTATIAGGLTAWGYYFVLLIFPCAALAARLRARPHLRRIGWFVVACLLLNAMDTRRELARAGSPVMNVLANELPLYGLTVLIALWLKVGR